jgi:hypothetical protein
MSLSIIDEELLTEESRAGFQFHGRFRISMKKDSYSLEEVRAAGNTLPERGPLCHECGAIIPVIEGIPEAAERRVRYCIRQNRPNMAMIELREAIGCSLVWAKLWVEHPAGAKLAKETMPCPYCGVPLRTSLSKQCRFCRTDWHDEDNVVTLS